MVRKRDNIPTPAMYSELASWFHLITDPEEYKEEAAFYMQVIEKSSKIPVKTVLEMGSGGGNNAFHMKSRYTLTLTDLSEDILKLSQKLNPECEHIQGDMRYLKLERQYDAVFVHDAIDYILSEADLLKTFQTAYTYCKPGGTVLFCPDFIRETFKECTETGGHDTGKRGLRYLDWTWDPDKKGESWVSHFVIIMRDGEEVEYRTDEHHCGLFLKQTWLGLMVKAGFVKVKAVHYPVNLKECVTPVFTGVKPKI
jgi:SAM-dependent methyltransferase